LPENEFPEQHGVVNIAGNAAVAGDIVAGNKVLNFSVSLPPAGISALHQLPSPPADFIGRADELSNLRDIVENGKRHIVSIWGMGGVGKAAFALKFAAEIKSQYPDAQLYINLNIDSKKPMSHSEAMAYVVRAFHPSAPLPANLPELVALYRSVLDSRRALLFFDNIHNADQVEPLVPPSSCLVLITSRLRFLLPGMVDIKLEQLSGPDAIDFLRRLAPRLNDSEEKDLDELCALCDYLPLALRAVGGSLHMRNHLSARDYARQLASSQHRLKLTAIETAFDASYALLDQDLRLRFRTLSVFHDTFYETAASEVWLCDTPEEAADILSDLLNYSMINFDESSGRYGLSGLVRLFADRLVTTEEKDDAQQRHAEHFRSVITVAEALYKEGGDSGPRAFALLDVERANIRAGQAWAVKNADRQAGAAELCIDYPECGTECLHVWLDPVDRIAWLEAELAVARRLNRPDAELSALGNLGGAQKDLSEYQRAIEYYELAAPLARKLGDVRAETIIAASLGQIYGELGQPRKAIAPLRNRLKLACEQEDREAEAYALSNLGYWYNSLGKRRIALKCTEAAIEISRDLGNRLLEGMDIGNLANIYLDIGDFQRGIDCARQSLDIILEFGDRRGEFLALNALGQGYRGLKEYENAIENYDRALDLADQLGDRTEAERILRNSALATEEMGNRTEAILRAESALQRAQSVGLHDEAAYLRDTLARWQDPEVQ
jgi:tetratricopeptide (TPR) repeat protein